MMVTKTLHEAQAGRPSRQAEEGTACCLVLILPCIDLDLLGFGCF
jgi:hypothetical protein